jgi:hypothetical protein
VATTREPLQARFAAACSRAVADATSFEEKARELEDEWRGRLGKVRQVNVGRRNRAFEAPGVIEAFTALERQIASPTGNTRISAPARRIPLRQMSQH